jgi:hypothetical protein
VGHGRKGALDCCDGAGPAGRASRGEREEVVSSVNNNTSSSPPRPQAADTLCAYRNGSGKSNILDSICFVLGITNLTTVSNSLLPLSTRRSPRLYDAGPRF